MNLGFMQRFREAKRDMQRRGMSASVALATLEAEKQEYENMDPKKLLKTVDLATSVVAEPIMGADLSSYLELARSAGLKGIVEQIEEDFAEQKKEYTQKAKSNALRRFLSENGISVYETGSVYDYMQHITPDGMQWGWCIASLGNNELQIQDLASGGKLPMYSKPIPDAVIMTMTKIQEQFPTAIFEVTDIFRQQRPDPFLRVYLREATDNKVYVRRESIPLSFNNEGTAISSFMKPSEFFIIERWDEPAYRMSR